MKAVAVKAEGVGGCGWSHIVTTFIVLTTFSVGVGIADVSLLCLLFRMGFRFLAICRYYKRDKLQLELQLQSSN